MKLYRILAGIAIVVTWPLISFGALVRLHGAGLACPDWPLCYGQLVPPPGFAISMEVGHRFVATLLGLLIISMLLVSHFKPDVRRGLRKASWLTLALVVFQGVLGGLTVIYGLHPLTVILHLVFGNFLLFVLVLVLKMATPGRIFHRGADSGHAARSRKRIILMGLTFTAIIISGGLNSSTYSGYSCQAFPLCHPGEPFSFYAEAHAPEAAGGEAAATGNDYNLSEMIHLAHRLIAVLGGLMILAAASGLARSAKAPADAWLGWSVCGLVAAEIGVGIVNALYFVPIPISALHTAIAATITLQLGFLYSRHFLRG